MDPTEFVATTPFPNGIQYTHTLTRDIKLVINEYDIEDDLIVTKWWGSEPTEILESLADDPAFGDTTVAAEFHYPGIDTHGVFEGTVDTLLDQDTFPDYCTKFYTENDSTYLRYETDAALTLLKTGRINPDRVSHYDETVGATVAEFQRKHDEYD